MHTEIAYTGLAYVSLFMYKVLAELKHTYLEYTIGTCMTVVPSFTTPGTTPKAYQFANISERIRIIILSNRMLVYVVGLQENDAW